MLYKQAYTFSWKKRWQRFFLLWFHNSSSLNCLVPPLSIHAFEREYGAKNACFACLQDYILKKKAFNAMKSQHVMSGILESWVESNMVTNTYTLNERWSVLMITGNLKAPVQPTRTWRSIAALGFLSWKCYAWPWRALHYSSHIWESQAYQVVRQGNSTLLTIKTCDPRGGRKKGEEDTYKFLDFPILARR